MDVLVVALFARHVKVDNLILVRIVDIVSCFDVKLSALFVLNDCTKSLGDSVEESSFTHARITHDSDFKAEVIVINLTTSNSKACICILLLLQEDSLVRCSKVIAIQIQD